MRNKLRFSQKKARIEEKLVQISRTPTLRSPCGLKLLSRVRESIHAEVMRSQWLAGKVENWHGLPVILAGLEAKEPPLPTPLSEAQLSVVRERVKIAWESLWHPPPRSR